MILQKINNSRGERWGRVGERDRETFACHKYVSCK